MKFISNQWAVASGSINGTTYSRNRTSAYTRNRSKPINRQSAMQSAVRAILAAFSSLWRTLDEDIREAWNAFAAGLTFSNGVDGTYVPTGSQAFQTVMQVQSLTSTTPTPDTPPAPGTAGTIVNMYSYGDLAAVDHNARLAVYSEVTDGSDKTLVYCTPPVSAGKSAGSIKNKFRILKIASSTSNRVLDQGGTVQGIANDYDAQFGTDISNGTALPANTKIWIKLVPVRTDYILGLPFIDSPIWS